MESFTTWQSRIAADGFPSSDESVIFLAYEASSVRQANAAGMEFLGTTWDASGVRAKAFRRVSSEVQVFSCKTCGKTAKSDQGMYCCGRKRVAHA
jgi:hypothetical protein